MVHKYSRERKKVEKEIEVFEATMEEVERVTTEDKICAAYEERASLTSPWEIEEMVQEALAQLPDDLSQEQTELIHDVLYETLTTAIENMR